MSMNTRALAKFLVPQFEFVEETRVWFLVILSVEFFLAKFSLQGIKLNNHHLHFPITC